jgi:hypothetical protein
VCRLLAARGIATLLPDLPGQGDSLLPTEQATLAAWRSAFAAASYGAQGVATFRAGALVAPRPGWSLSPLTGSELLRDLHRLRAAGDDPDTFGGNRLSPTLLAELEHAPDPAPARTLRLDTDPRPADRKLAAPPLWRRVEPGTDAGLAEAVAEDIAAWLTAA